MKQLSWQGLVWAGIFCAAALGAWALGNESLAVTFAAAATAGAFVPTLRKTE